MMSDFKVMRDPVHGDIKISKQLCKLFVDTKIFQRLRGIEQTSSMRWLFPGARHDRFIHSLGVYHLADRMYEALKRNVREKDSSIKAILKDQGLKSTFLVAALMHDCGHAPFSHTTEFLYNCYCIGSDKHNETYNKLKECVASFDKASEGEFAFGSIGKVPAHHEVMSALVLLEHYSDEMKKLGANPVLAARMITGRLHGLANNARLKVENALIKLINGDAIDVDKLDYILRDTWATGVKNAAIDVDRLLDSALLSFNENGEIEFSYKMTALSVVQTVVDSRNYIYEWVCGHHTVVYYGELLKRLCKKLGVALTKDKLQEGTEEGRKACANDVMKRLFSFEGIFPKQDNALDADGGHVSIRLMNDGDLMGLFKRCCSNSWEYLAFSRHIPNHIPLWKSEADYRSIIDKRKHNTFGADECVAKVRQQFTLSEDQCFACDGTSSKIYDIDPEEIRICMRNGRKLSYGHVANTLMHPRATKQHQYPFFYVFVDKCVSDKVDEILKFINSYNWR